MASKVILVTGSNTGIGYAAVHLFAAKGHTVYLASRNEAAGKDAVAKIKQEKNLDVKFVQLDVTDVASIKAAVATIDKAEKRLDVLVNNAAIGELGKPQGATAVDVEHIRRVFDVNFFGLIQTTTAFMPLLRAASTPENPSAIVNVTSGGGSNGFQAGPRGMLREYTAYNPSKAALNAYTIALAHELKAENIKVNAVAPGFTTTNLNGNKPGGKTPEQGAEVILTYGLQDKDGKTGLFVAAEGEIPW
ncbi:hypothetical protein C8J57DRAFT_1395176 [Mycena rebaudengoi]|nr:hypothetical protein C8J57DRAFT_1395176 [Mycena rebaudengoi]